MVFSSGYVWFGEDIGKEMRHIIILRGYERHSYYT